MTKSKTLLEAMHQQIPWALRASAFLIGLRVGSRFTAESKAIARMFDVDWRNVFLAGMAYDLVLATFACSTIALATPSGPVLARNMDFWPESLLAQASALVSYSRNGKEQFIQAGWPGSIAIVSGMSSHGFAVVVNAVISKEKWLWHGFPVLLHLRRVIEDAENFAAAVRQLSEVRLMSSALFTVVGQTNSERVVIERTPTRSVQRWPKTGAPLIVTNDYRCLDCGQTTDDESLFGTTCRRYAALERCFGQHDGRSDISDDELLFALTDPQVIQSITAQHVIFRPAFGASRLFVPSHFLA